jgi:thiazole synthase
MRSAAFIQVIESKSFILRLEAEMGVPDIKDKLNLYGLCFASRLLLGSSRYESPRQLVDAIRAADPAMLTVSLRRQLPGRKDAGQAFWNLLRETNRTILPNTAGCQTAREAVSTACVARELFETSLIKLEVIGDEVNLQPDPFELVEAASELIKLGFKVLPYCTEDWVVCKRLIDVGCEVLMPWAAPIGTGQGPRNASALRELRQRAPHIPLIIDAGIGLPSHACQLMEWGFDGLLLNTAVSRAIHPGGDGRSLCRSRPGRPQCLSGRTYDRPAAGCTKHPRVGPSFLGSFTRIEPIPLRTETAAGMTSLNRR